MQAWWRVLRGIWPYRWMVALSIFCAFGVGISYAAGVGVMLPVMKIFISAEGVHGWADRIAADLQLDATLQDLDTTNRRSKPDEQDNSIEVSEVGKTGAPQLAPPEPHLLRQIKSVTKTVNGAPVVYKTWKEMVETIAHIQGGEQFSLQLSDIPEPVTLTGRQAPFYTRAFLWTADLLPRDGPDHPNAATQSLIMVVLFFIFLCILGSAFRYLQQYFGSTVANRVVMDIRRHMYERVVQLPTSYFAQKGTSDVMSRLTGDVSALTDGVSMALGKTVQEPIKAVFAFIAALWINWWLCLLIVFCVPFLGLVIRKFSKHMRRSSRKALESWSMMLAIINETLIGARVVKAYTAEGYERRRFARANKKLLKEQMKINHYSALSRPVIETMAVIMSSIPMVLAAHLVLKGKVDREGFFTLLACFAAMLEPLRKLADVNYSVQRTNAAATRVFEVIDMEPEPNTQGDLPRLPQHRRSIEFRDITFNYPGHSENVLTNVSFMVRAGQTVAVVGGNGSGKTTLLNLVPRLYVATKGQILVDGVDTAGVSVRSLRRQIGLVTQDTLLFADTIYNNIAYGSRHSSREQVMEAARRSYADEFIRGFPEGYETRVGEHGVRLSGGQKQRIAIARAILREPPILILDEAMSQIDSDSEGKISAALQAFTQNRTTFVIAHRFVTVVNADQIVCLEAGRVCGIGTHAQLLETCQQYSKLYENQFREAPAA